MDHITVQLFAEITKLKSEIEELRAWRASFLDQKAAKPKLPFLEQFPDLATIVRFKAQLWENKSCQGVPRYMVKIAVWDRLEARNEAEQKSWPNGYYNNWCFSLTTLDEYSDRATWQGKTNPDYWLGCVAHKGNRKCKGTRLLRDHMAFLHPTDRHLLLRIGNRRFEFLKGTPIVSADPKSPCHVWYLDL
jgi:hypothetical protein